MKSGNTYTSNRISEMIEEIVGNLKNDIQQILFRMDSGHFDEEIIKKIEK